MNWPGILTRQAHEGPATPGASGPGPQGTQTTRGVLLWGGLQNAELELGL